MTILVTGASGFVGTGLMARLSAENRLVRGTSRKPVGELADRTGWVAVEDQDDSTDWRAALEGVGTVVHLAGRAHIIRDRHGDSLAAFRRTNVEGTLNLARQAASAGVRRFVFVSSIKVNGEAGTHRESDTPAPNDAYGVSKLEAENGLREIAATTALGVVVIRPPLVYGPGVKANFQALVRAVGWGIPLPLGAIENRRSLVARDNLVDFIVTCIEHPAAGGETFFVSDGEDMSTTTLIRRIARAMKRPARLIPVPVSVLWAAATVAGKRDVAQRLLGSLQLDIAKARRVLAWTPPVTVDEGLRRAVGNVHPRRS
jgi:nucleoside-diphosphate-sugar epimerase